MSEAVLLNIVGGIMSVAVVLCMCSLILTIKGEKAAILKGVYLSLAGLGMVIYTVGVMNGTIKGKVDITEDISPVNQEQVVVSQEQQEQVETIEEVTE